MAVKTTSNRLMHGNARYPWRSWATGEVWEAKRGEDFHVEPDAFISAARAWAKKNSLRVRATVEGDSVAVFQFLPEGTE